MKVTFQIEGATPVSIECNAGDNLLELARRANVAIDAPCSGNGSCGKCRVKLVEGRLDSAPSRHISQEEYDAGWRLSCCAKVLEDCVVFVPDIASAYQSRMKTADLSSPKEIAIFTDCQEQLKASGIHFENSFRAYDLTMAEPTLDDTMPDVDVYRGYRGSGPVYKIFDGGQYPFAHRNSRYSGTLSPDLCAEYRRCLLFFRRSAVAVRAGVRGVHSGYHLGIFRQALAFYGFGAVAGGEHLCRWFG